MGTRGGEEERFGGERWLGAWGRGQTQAWKRQRTGGEGVEPRGRREESPDAHSGGEKGVGTGWAVSVHPKSSIFLLAEEAGWEPLCGRGGPRHPHPNRHPHGQRGSPPVADTNLEETCISEVVSGGRRHATGWESLATFCPHCSPVGGWGISGQRGGRGGEGGLIDRQWSSELPRVSSQTEGRVLGSRVWMKGALSQGPSGVESLNQKRH